MYNFYKIFSNGYAKHVGTYESTLDPEYHAYINWCKANRMSWKLVDSFGNIKFQEMFDNETTTIIAVRDLHNNGKCFTGGKEYEVKKRITNRAALMDLTTTNDMGEIHQIGGWWRQFEIKQVKS